LSEIVKNIEGHVVCVPTLDLKCRRFCSIWIF